MIDKFNTFLNSNNKIELLKEKTRIIFPSMFYRINFKFFGKSSQIINPMRIFGKRYISIGNNVTILNGARIEAIDTWGGQKFAPGIMISDNVSVGQNCHITVADKLVIGKNVVISGNVFITDIDHDYTNTEVSIMNQKLIVKQTSIGENSFIGFGAAIQAGTILGKHCIVGTNAVVRGVFDDYSVIAGVPAKVIKKYNFSTSKWEKIR